MFPGDQKTVNIVEGESPTPSPLLFLVSAVPLEELVLLLAYISETDPFPSFSARFLEAGEKVVTVYSDSFLF